jgi:hypothetical protein
MEATVALAAANEGISMNNLASPKRIPSNFCPTNGDLLGSPRHPDGSLHVAELDTFLNLSF